MDFKTTAELDARSQAEMVGEGVVTNLTAGARALALLQIMNRRVGEAYDTLKFNVAMGFLSTSTGIFLDLLGSLTGTIRRSSQTALVDREDKIIKFYVVTGTLKSKIGSGVIPIGTTITDPTGSITYQVTVAANFDAVTDQVYVSAAAQSSGTENNVGTNILTVHSLGNPDVFVTNEKNISSGQDVEGDDNYRYRIANSRAVLESGNLTAVRLAMLPVPGVSDIIMNEFAGYMDALILPTGNWVSDSIVQACQFLGEREKSGGIRLSARAPDMVTFETYVQIQTTRETPSTQVANVKEAVRSVILGYFDDIQMAGEFVVRQMSQRIQDADSRVYDHRIVCLNFDRRPQLVRNHRLLEDQLFTPDPQSENPVTVAIA